MPDIAKCSGEKGKWTCPKRKKCYRYTAKPDKYWQSYFMTPPYKKKKCEYFYK